VAVEVFLVALPVPVLEALEVSEGAGACPMILARMAASAAMDDWRRGIAIVIVMVRWVRRRSKGGGRSASDDVSESGGGRRRRMVGSERVNWGITS
jgi:hypothetical protein